MNIWSPLLLVFIVVAVIVNVVVFVLVVRDELRARRSR